MRAWMRFVVCLGLLVGCGERRASDASGTGGVSGTELAMPQHISADPDARLSLTRNEPNTGGESSAPMPYLPVFGTTGGLIVGVRIMEPTEAVDAAQPKPRADIVLGLDDHHLVTLTAGGELKVVDVSKPAAPATTGSVRVPSSASQLFVAGDSALVVVPRYAAYGAQPGEPGAQFESWTLLVLVDLSDRAAPRLVERLPIPGWFHDAHLAVGGGAPIFYVVTSEEVIDEAGEDAGAGRWSQHTKLRSLRVEAGGLLPVAEYHTPGYPRLLRGFDDRLVLVKGGTYEPSILTIFDSSAAAAGSLEGHDLALRGAIEKGTDMAMEGTILRVLDGRQAMSAAGTDNYLGAWDLADATNPVRVSDCAFGRDRGVLGIAFAPGQALVQTIVDGELRKETIAFSPDGDCSIEQAATGTPRESFRALVFASSRLLSVAEDASASSVTLRAPADPGAPPLAKLKLPGVFKAPSVASVYEGIDPVLAEDGTEETGLVLLPMADTGVMAVSFSETTLTLRGELAHAGNLERTALVGVDRIVTVAQDQMRSFALPKDGAIEQGGVTFLAPLIPQLLTFGDYRIRVRPALAVPIASERMQVAEVLLADQPPNTAEVVASFELFSGAQVFKVGSLLVALTSADVSDADGIETDIEVYDLSDPRKPRRVGSLSTDRLPRLAVPALQADPQPLGDGHAFAAGQALVVARAFKQSRALGERAYCSRVEQCDRAPRGDEVACQQDAYYAVHAECFSAFGEGQWCAGGTERCDVSLSSCVPTAENIPTRERCSTDAWWQTWDSYAFEVLDLTDPAEPTLAPKPLLLPADLEGLSVLVAVDQLHIAVKKAHEIPSDPRPYAAYGVATLDLSSPAAPALVALRNVPGELFGIAGDVWFTHGYAWVDDEAQPVVSRLKLQEREWTVDKQRTLSVGLLRAATRLPSGDLLLDRPHTPLEWVPTSMFSLLSPDNLKTASVLAVADRNPTVLFATKERVGVQVYGGGLLLDVSDSEELALWRYLETGDQWFASSGVEAGAGYFAPTSYGEFRFDLQALAGD